MAERASGKYSAGVVVVHGTEASRFLLLRSFRYWDFPKGAVEAGETPLEAARREVAEETGIGALEFDWGETYRETAPYRGGKIARYYIARSVGRSVRLLPNPVLGRAEHDEFRWLDYAAAHLLLVPRVQAILDWAVEVIGIDRVERKSSDSDRGRSR